MFSREEEITGQGRETMLGKKKGKTSEIRIPPDVPKPHVISRDKDCLTNRNSDTEKSQQEMEKSPNT